MVASAKNLDFGLVSVRRATSYFAAGLLLVTGAACSDDTVNGGWNLEAPASTDTGSGPDTAPPRDTDVRTVEFPACEPEPGERVPMANCAETPAMSVEFGWEEGHTSLTGLELGPTGCPRVLYEQGNRVEFAAWNGQKWSVEVVAHNKAVSSSVQLDSALAVDACDRPFVAYIKDDRAHLARRIDGTWRSERISTVSDVRKLDLALHPSGLPAVVLRRDVVDQAGNADDALLYGLRNSDRWRTSRIYGPAERVEIDQTLAFTPEGVAHSAFISDEVVYHATATQPGSWDVRKTAAPFQAGMANLALDSRGNPHIVTCPGPGGGNDPVRHLFRTSDGWRGEDVTDDINPNPYCHTAAFDPRGRLHTLILKADGVGNNEIRHATRVDGQWQIETLTSGRYLRPAPRIRPAPAGDALHTFVTGQALAGPNLDAIYRRYLSVD